MTDILFGSATDGEIFALTHQNVRDDGTAVCLRAITATWVPNGWWGTALWRTVILNISSNVGATVRVTPVVDGVTQTSITYTVPVPVAGERTENRTILGLSRPVSIGVTAFGKVALRGTSLAFLVETVGVLDTSNGETNPDFRAEAVSVAVQPQLRTQQVANA